MKFKANNPMNAEQKLHLGKGEFVLTEGVWDENTPWKFIVSNKEPPPDLCTAAFCVAVSDGKILLVQQRDRDWELPGGHIDEGEEIEGALIRETLEESGAVVENLRMFGYKLVLPSSPVPHRETPGKFYPFPRSYVPYYYAQATEILNVRLSPDVIGSRVVSFNEAKTMLSPGHNHDKILEHLVTTNLIHVNQ